MRTTDNSHRGRLRQIPIYLGKCFRTFIFMDDWKVLPMAALIGGLVAFVACSNLFVTMEGTTSGGFAMVCVCIWNGFFNSIQVVCRERNIVKREHRSGMHISSYVAANMIYQAFLCMMQTVIILTVCRVAGVNLSAASMITPWFAADIGITMFLITYTADMLSLMVSCIVSNPTTAMTVMPFILIVQLVLSGTMFRLDGKAAEIEKITISKWGMDCLCSQAHFNDLPTVSLWNQIFKYRDFEIEGIRPVEGITNYMMDNHLVDAFCQKAGQFSQNPAYAGTPAHVLKCWLVLIAFALSYALIGMLFLERIDRDKR